MTETGVSFDNLSLNVKPSKAYGESDLAGVVGVAEVQLRQGRLEKGEVRGVLGKLETSLKFLGEELGFGRIADETRAFNAKVGSMDGDREGFDRLKQEVLDDTGREAQIEFLASGVESMKPVVAHLMDVRGQAPELNGKVVVDGLKRIGSEFLAASAEDVEAAQAFFDGAEVARHDMFTKLGKMWDAKEALDSVHKVQEIVDIGRDVAREDQYQFTMESGWKRQVVSVVRRFVPGLAKRFGQLPHRAGVNANAEVDSRLSQLRTDALRIGGADQDIRLWKAGIISRSELGDGVEVGELLKMGISLDAAEQDAIRDGSELNQYLAEGKFKRVSQARQTDYFKEFYTSVVKSTEGDFNTAKEAYFQFDVKNAAVWGKDGLKVPKGVFVKVDNWVKSKGEVLGADKDMVAELITVPVPKLVKEWGSALASVGAEGVLTAAKVPGGAIDFAIDRVEAVIAGDALERLSSVMVAKEQVMRSFRGTMASNEAGPALLEGAMAVRGSEAVMFRAMAYATRCAETVDMTNGKGTLKAMGNEVGALPRAGLEYVTGGVWSNENIGKVFDELRDRARLLDGKVVVEKYGDGGNLAIAERLIESTAREQGVPAEYMDDEAMDQHMRSSWTLKVAEFTRKQVGPEGQAFGLDWIWNTAIKEKLLKMKDVKHLKDREWWQVVAGESKRQTVKTVQEKLSARLAASTKAVDALRGKAGEIRSEQLNPPDRNILVESSTAVVLNDAHTELMTSEVSQIKKRSQLDKMWAKVANWGPKAAGLALLGLLVAQGHGTVADWASNAHADAAQAGENLDKMQHAYDVVMETAKAEGMHATGGGAGIDLGWKKLLNSLAESNEASAVWTQANFLKIQLGALVTAAVAPLLAAAPAAFEALPFRMAPRTKFMANTGNVK